VFPGDKGLAHSRRRGHRSGPNRDLRDAAYAGAHGRLKTARRVTISEVTSPQERVPYRTIIATVGIVLATILLLLLIRATQQVLTWMVIAAFFAVALYPAVNWIESRARWIRRSIATLLLFLAVVVAILGLITLFVVPLAREATALARQIPGMVQDVQAGRGTVGSLVERFHGLDLLKQHQDQLQGYVSNLGGGLLGFLQGTATSIAATLTIFVLAYLMVLEGPKIVATTLGLFSPPRASRLQRVGTACARSITGYLTGNLLISAIAGGLTYLALLVLGVPYSGLLALFVAIADLIPLVGATLGAVVVTAVGFTQDVRTGVILIIFFVVYQQLENHLLQPLIFSRTVRLNPLTALVAILVFTSLAGLLGALLAIPAAAMIQIILRDIWAHRRGRPLDDAAGATSAPAVPVSPAAGATPR
jgi:predicted PurR-regulated permease PerM